MGLQCLIVTCDPGLINHLKAGFGEHKTALDLRQDSASAVELATRRHFDGLVIDCDDVTGGTDAIAQVRNCRSNKQTLIIAVVNGSTSVDQALDSGANFVVSKPIQETRLRAVLDVAIPKMEREHRRYFRYEAQLPVRFRNHSGQTSVAAMKNVSEGGLAVKLSRPTPIEGVLNVEFEIPSVDAPTFHAKADVVWSDSFVMGLRFLYIEKDSGVALQAWLNSLGGQLQLRDSALYT